MNLLPSTHGVLKNGVDVGILKSWYGNNGKGKLAAEEFTPAEGVKVVGEKEK